MRLDYEDTESGLAAMLIQDKAEGLIQDVREDGQAAMLDQDLIEEDKGEIISTNLPPQDMEELIKMLEHEPLVPNMEPETGAAIASQSHECTEESNSEDEGAELVVYQLRSGSMLKVPVCLEGNEIEAVVDTAAQVTIISDKLFKKLKWDGVPLRTVALQMAGREMKIHGAVFGPLALRLGAVKYKEVYVAPIEDDMLLGLGFIRRHGVDIKITEGVLQIGEENIPMNIETKQAAIAKTRRVMVASRVVIPPNSVKVVSCKVKKQRRTFIVEPTEEGDWLVPRTLQAKGTNPKVCFVNLSGHNIVLRKDQVVGEAEPARAVPENISKRVANVSLGVTGKSAEIPEHLKAMLEQFGEQLKPEEVSKFKEMLCEFKDVFAENEYDLGDFSEIKHQINTGEAKPVRQRMRRTPLGFASEEKAHLDKMLNAGVIRPSQSEWASAPVLIRKRDGSVRWCVDYREVNKITDKDLFPLPLVEDCLDTLAGNVYFSKVDANSAYWQVRIEEEDIKKTAFITKYGLFEFSRMPFGLCNAPATYCRVMNLVLRGLNWDTVLAFLDDILVLGKSFDDHLQNLRQVFTRLRDFGLRLKPKKCAFFQAEVEFLGRRVSQAGLRLGQEHIEAVVKWPIPRSSKEVEQFLGLVNYHRLFLKDLAKFSVPLYAVTGKGNFRWGGDQEIAFQQIKAQLTSAPMLALPNSTDAFILDTDASDYAIGAELLQLQEGKERVIAFGSLALTKEQRRYCTTRKELLAVIRFTRQYRHYLLGQKFVLRTDHSSLQWLLNFKQPQGQLARWLEELSQYNVYIQHRPGKKHLNADAMSRIPRDTQSCSEFQHGVTLKELPCGGCPYCKKAHEHWSEFVESVDYAVPLPQRSQANREEEIHHSRLNVIWMPSETHQEGYERESWSMAEVTLGDPVQTGLKQEQAENTDLQLVRRWLKDGTVPTEGVLFQASPAAKNAWIHRAEYSIEEELLYRQKPEGPKRIVVPKDLRIDIFHANHDLPSGVTKE